MNLRPYTPPALRWSWRLALFGVALLALGRSVGAADAGTGSYPSPLYVSGAVSSLIANSNALVGNAGPGPLTAPAAAPTGGADPGPSGTYSYVYTVVDPTGGETAPSPVATSAPVTNNSITVTGLPGTGNVVYLYRKGTDFYRRVAELPSSHVGNTYVDQMSDATAQTMPVLASWSQNRIAGSVSGTLNPYQNFFPGRFDPCCYLPLSGTSTAANAASITPTGRGWLVDGSGNVSFPMGAWTFNVQLAQVNSNAGRGAARLVVGMWKVTVVPGSGAITSPTLIVDPRCTAAPCASGAWPGDSTTGTNFITSGTPASVTVTNAVNNVGAFHLGNDEHLYVQFWRRQTAAITGGYNATTGTATLFGYDGGTTQITHPAVNGPPVDPSFASVPARLNSPTPNLSIGYSDAEGDAGTVALKLCSDANCAAVLQTTTASVSAGGTSATWTPTTLPEGTYYLQAQATDSNTNVSGVSTGSFVVDTTPPNVPALTSPAASARANQVTATFTEPDTADPSGRMTFEVCGNSTCSGSALATTTTAALANGASASWTPPLADASYYWRVKAQDGATNTSAWSAIRAFRLDTAAPPAPSLDSPANGAQLTALPSLSAKYVNTDSGDSGPLSFQICTDQACSNVVASGNSATLTNGAYGSWKPASVPDGTLWARVRALDVAGNALPWQPAAVSFYLDATPPAVPTGSGVDAGARIARIPTLTASFSDNAGRAGSLTFQVCTDQNCNSVVATTSPKDVANGTSSSWTPSLGDGRYYWRARAEDSLGNESAWSAATRFVIDTTPPPSPTLVSAAGLRSKTAPTVSARTTRSDPDETMRLAFQVCSDAACAFVRGTGYASAEGGDASAQWQAPALEDGTYYWRAFAVDGAANESGWSPTRPFAIDNTAPDVPTPAADAPERVKKAQLAASFTTADAGDSGTIFFELCTDLDCASVIATGSDDGLGPGSMGRWTAALLRDGDYYWRVRAEDVAGNSSAWSATQHFTLDTSPPGKPREFAGTLKANMLSLHWKAPVVSDGIDAYILFVNGNRSRSVDASSLGLDIHLRAGDRRSFAVAAVDETGNVGVPTRAVVLVPKLARLTLDQAKAATADQGLLLRWSKRTTKAAPTRVIGQSPAPQTIVETGSLVTVVVDGPARASRR